EDRREGIVARWHGFGESRMRWKSHVRFGGRTRETHQRKRWQGALVRPYLANTRLDETRRRVQHNIYGHRGRGEDPLYRIRKLLTMAKERLTENANVKLTRFLEAGDPDNEVATAERAKESLDTANSSLLRLSLWQRMSERLIAS
ncbi:Transposase, partial [Ferrithrix thermotolerans DSM 19514]